MLKNVNAAAFVLISILGCQSAVANPCPAITSVARSKLVDYVQKKYKVPPERAIELASSSLVGSSCFRKLEFRAKDPKSNFAITLFASPDLKFLSRELLDTSVDPLEEERRQARELTAGLTHGVFPVLGPQNAPVTITVFSDFECPYCAQLAKMLKTDVLPQEAGKVRLAFRNFPLPFHPWARAAAETTACVADQNNDAFWRLHDFIFEHQRDFTPDNVRKKLTDEARRTPKFDEARLTRCLADKKLAARIDQDIAFGTQAGVRGTPTLFVNGFRASGSDPVQIRSLIRELGQHQGKEVAILR